MKVKRHVLAATLAGLMLQGCGADEKDRPASRVNQPAPVQAVALFNPAAGADALPFPNDLLFAGSVDGTVNIPGKYNSGTAATPPAPALADPQTALNTLDGFSTVANMVVRFSGAVNADSIPPAAPGESPGIILLKAGGPAPLMYGMDYLTSVSQGTTGMILPLRPLDPGSSYVIAVTDKVETVTGSALGSDDTYALLKAAFLLSGPMGDHSLRAEFMLDGGGLPCDPTAMPPACVQVNHAAYSTFATAVESLDPVAAAGARQIASTLEALETAGQMEQLLQLEGMRQMVADQLAALAGAGVDVESVVLSYSVTTQNLNALMIAARDTVTAAPAATFQILNPLSLWSVVPEVAIVSPGDNGVPDAADDHHAHVYTGVLAGVPQFVDLANQNTTVWQRGGNNLSPVHGYEPDVVASDAALPLLVTTPRPDVLAAPATPEQTQCAALNAGPGLPVVIFQHGITANRGSIMALADTLAQTCAVGVAIDLPKHGILPDPARDRFAPLSLGDAELLVQSVAPAGGAPLGSCTAGLPVDVSDDASGDWRCPSGDNFINLTNLANSRDMMRQAVMNLVTLAHALRAQTDGGPLETDLGVNIDPDNIHFVGMSLGGIVGVPFVALDGAIETATFNVAGGGIAKILDGSPTFEPQITAGLAQNGVVKPGGDYEGFMIIAQTMVDSVDPINWVDEIVTAGTPVLVQEVVGNGDVVGCLAANTGCADMVVPNNVFGPLGDAWGLVSGTGQLGYLPGQHAMTVPSALAGTDPLAQGTAFVALAGNGLLGDPVLHLEPLPGLTPFYGFGLTEQGAAGCSPGDCSGVVRFTAGGHGSLLDPSASAAVTVAMQTQLAGFIGSHVQSGGAATMLPAVDASVVRK